MGGNSADVQHQLIDVVTIEVYSFAWAALRACACTELQHAKPAAKFEHLEVLSAEAGMAGW